MASIKWIGQVEVRTTLEYAAIYLRSDLKPARKRPKKSSLLGIPLWSLWLKARRRIGESTKSVNLAKPGNGRVGWEEGTWSPSINKTLFFQSCLVEKLMRKGNCECLTWRHRWIEAKAIPCKKEKPVRIFCLHKARNQSQHCYFKNSEKKSNPKFTYLNRIKKTIWNSFFLDVQNN